uniref:Uncharacterized protein n=1 Tax=Tanacetum cinerariifolium TaxID=118510 RepID=A0A6L2L4A7_TANCI|nr:hypothetical protein [Tanacetum cinerariifolium]
MKRFSSRRLSTTTWVRWKCSQNISLVSKGKGLFGPNGKSGKKFEGGLRGKVGSCGGNGGKEGSMAEIGGRGGSMVEIRGVENISLMGSKIMASGEECLDGWVGVGKGEVKGDGVVFKVSRIEFGMIRKDNMEESGGEAFELDEGAD